MQVYFSFTLILIILNSCKVTQKPSYHIFGSLSQCWDGYVYQTQHLTQNKWRQTVYEQRSSNDFVVIRQDTLELRKGGLFSYTNQQVRFDTSLFYLQEQVAEFHRIRMTKRGRGTLEHLARIDSTDHRQIKDSLGIPAHSDLFYIPTKRDTFVKGNNCFLFDSPILNNQTLFHPQQGIIAVKYTQTDDFCTNWRYKKILSPKAIKELGL